MALGLKQREEDPWLETIPARFRLGEEEKGTVLRITDFGLFVELEGGVEGLIYSSEIVQPSGDDTIKEGDTVDARIIKIDASERKIGLSMKNVKKAEE
jgi:ribosomal protein S1